MLAFAAAAVYYQVCTYDFINYDDQIYVYDNPSIQSGITLKSVEWAFTTGYANFWHPLTWLSYMLDWQLFGNNAGGYHLTNLFLHIANTLLLFLVLKQMTSALWQSAFVAALFALHPLHVESVVWVAERKDVLSTFFWVLTMWAYLRYVRKPNVIRYLLALLTFVLGLMAKPMLVTLPFVLLLLDYWPLNRISRFDWRTVYRLVLEKVPFMVLAVIFSVIAFFVQQRGGAITSLAEIPLKFRVYNALISYAEYICKMFWPSKLAVFYPHPGSDISILYVIISAGFLLAITVLVIRLARNHRYLLVGWLWYIGTLLPVIGLIQVGNFAMADRYTYITLTGLFIMISWGAADLLAKSRHKKIILSVSALSIILVLSICTRLQLRHWRSSLDLFYHTLDVTKNNYAAHYNIAGSMVLRGRLDEAIYHYSQAIRISPDYVDAINGLGVALHKAGRVDDAIGHFKRAIEIDPGTPEAYSNLGLAFSRKGRFDEAVKYYRIAVEIRDTPDAHKDLGVAMLNLGMFRQAVAEYRKVLSVMPNDPNTLNSLGYALMNTGEFDEAVSLYNKALQIAPDSVNIRLNLGAALINSGKFAQAEKEYEKILLIQPQNAVAHNDFAVVLLRQKKFDKAIEHFNRALEINPQYTDAKNNLSIALAEKLKLRNPENIKK